MYLENVYNDNELLLLIAQGDEKAFVVFFKQWQPFLATHIFRITDSRELAEEIVQDVFLKIWITRETLTEVKNIKAYLVTVSRNHAINELNRIVRGWGKIQSLNESALPDKYVEADENVPDIKYAFLDEAIDQLPPRQKQIYLLNRHERLSYNEIAGKLGLGRESVKRNLQLASRTITKIIKAKLTLLILILESFK